MLSDKEVILQTQTKEDSARVGAVFLEVQFSLEAQRRQSSLFFGRLNCWRQHSSPPRSPAVYLAQPILSQTNAFNGRRRRIREISKVLMCSLWRIPFSMLFFTLFLFKRTVRLKSILNTTAMTIQWNEQSFKGEQWQSYLSTPTTMKCSLEEGLTRQRKPSHILKTQKRSPDCFYKRRITERWKIQFE